MGNGKITMEDVLLFEAQFATNPICHNIGTANCFAKKDGRCTILKDTKFKNHRCPFFKAKEVKK